MSLVLVVDDDLVVAKLVARMVEFCGHEAVTEMDSMRAVTAHVKDPRLKAVLADYLMPKLDGLELLMAFADTRPEVRRVLITAAPHERAVQEAKKAGLVQMVIAKPPAIADIELALAWL
jgi:response regulator of citrate/malate metabolism